MPTRIPWLSKQEYPFEHHWLKLPAGRMQYIDEGSGHPIIFVHGTPGWSFEFRHIIKKLRDQYRCIAFDHIGFGLSDKPPTWDYSLQHHTENLKHLIDHLNLRSFSLVLHDFGGPISFPLIFSHREKVSSIILLNTWLWPIETCDPDFAKTKKIAGSFLMKFLYIYFNFSAKFMLPMAWGSKNPLSKEIHRNYLEPFSKKDDRLGTWSFAKSICDNKHPYWQMEKQLNEIENTPTLILWGNADQFIKPVHLEKWRKSLPNARVREMFNVGHFPHDEDADFVGKEIFEFLERP